MVDVGPMWPPEGVGSAILPRLGTTSSSGAPLEAAAATSISDLYSLSAVLGPLVNTSPSGSNLSQQLTLVSTLINANVPTRVWEVNLSSFDTHAGEQNGQDSLLAEVDASVGAFMTSINAGSHANDVTVLIYSEFGRRVASNASYGTDHGSSAPVFIIGNSVKGGLYGEQPSCGSLDVNGNLQVTADFRSVYGGVLENVLNTPVGDVIPSWSTTISVQ
jgi:uncharacterized protein (DUF1501 family)